VNDKVLAEVGIGQTLAPQPVGFNFTAAGEYRLGEALAARGALELDARSVAFDLTGGEAKVKDAGVSILVGLTYWLTESP
jgi:hypothetical protein